MKFQVINSDSRSRLCTRINEYPQFGLHRFLYFTIQHSFNIKYKMFDINSISNFHSGDWLSHLVCGYIKNTLTQSNMLVILKEYTITKVYLVGGV